MPSQRDLGRLLRLQEEKKKEKEKMKCGNKECHECQGAQDEKKEAEKTEDEKKKEDEMWAGFERVFWEETNKMRRVVR